MERDDEIALYAKLTQLEFVLEVVVAKGLAEAPEDSAQEFLRGLVDTGAKRAGYITDDLEAADWRNAHSEKVTQFLSAFATRVTDRRGSILRQYRDSGLET